MTRTHWIVAAAVGGAALLYFLRPGLSGAGASRGGTPVEVIGDSPAFEKRNTDVIRTGLVTVDNPSLWNPGRFFA